MLLLQTAEVLLAAVGVDLLLCKVVGAAAGDDEGAPPDPVGSLVVSFFFLLCVSVYLWEVVNWKWWMGM